MKSAIAIPPDLTEQARRAADIWLDIFGADPPNQDAPPLAAGGDHGSYRIDTTSSSVPFRTLGGLPGLTTMNVYLERDDRILVHLRIQRGPLGRIDLAFVERVEVTQKTGFCNLRRRVLTPANTMDVEAFARERSVVAEAFSARGARGAALT
jgi:hypothetical protein